ncbi:MAG: hypothetical protein HRT90_01365, partial [Candidatus Margulisbacteria bacterium]|nr:hypothetical protein [Candidatus Margulisiibacteriota bacterium]
TTLIKSTSNEVVSTANPLTVFESSSFNKDELRIKKSEYRESFLSFKRGPEMYTWEGTSKAIKRGYDIYLVAFYTQENRFYLKTFSESIASGNNTLKLEPHDRHDTFISSLFLMDLVGEGYIDSPDKLDDLNMIYPSGFSLALPYTQPQNIVETFDVKKPEFTFDGSFESQLLSLFYKVETNPDEAIEDAKNIPKKWISDSSRNTLLSILEIRKKQD